MSVLRVTDLSVSVRRAPDQQILKGVSFDLEPNEVLAIAGESGSGKTMTALSIMGILPDALEVSSGEIHFKGQDLLRLPESKFRKIRGNEISIIFQDPASCLNPINTVGDQLVEMLRNHTSLSRKASKARAVELLDKVGIPEPEQVYKKYPHQLSGGMNQRVLIAMMALCTQPKILIADEPTTALDVTVERKILDDLMNLVREFDMSLMFITHNFGLVAEYADRVIVMKDGEIVETNNVIDLFEKPKHPYTQSLLDAVPKIAFDREIPKGGCDA